MSEWSDGMSERDQLKVLASENARLRAALEKLDEVLDPESGWQYTDAARAQLALNITRAALSTNTEGEE